MPWDPMRRRSRPVSTAITRPPLPFVAACCLLVVAVTAGCRGMSGHYDERQPLSLQAEESQDGPEEGRPTDGLQNATEPPDVVGGIEDTGRSYCIVFEDTGA